MTNNSEQSETIHVRFVQEIGNVLRTSYNERYTITMIKFLPSLTESLQQWTDILSNYPSYPRTQTKVHRYGIRGLEYTMKIHNYKDDEKSFQ